VTDKKIETRAKVLMLLGSDVKSYASKLGSVNKLVLGKRFIIKWRAICRKLTVWGISQMWPSCI
jgi:hypothetical protein